MKSYLSYRNKHRIRRNVTSKRGVKTKRLIIVFIISIIAICLVVVYYLRVSTVSIRSTKPSQAEIINKFTEYISKKFIGKNMLSLNVYDVVVNYNGNRLNFNVDKIVKKYPNDVEVYISLDESDPLYVVDNTGVFYMVNNDGIVLRVAKPKDGQSNFVKLDNTLSIGSVINISIVDSVGYLLNQSDVKFDSLAIKNNLLYFRYNSDYDVVFPVICDESMFEDKLSLLKKIAQQYTIDSRSVDVVDLRYSKPTIKFK